MTYYTTLRLQQQLHNSLHYITPTLHYTALHCAALDYTTTTTATNTNTTTTHTRNITETTSTLPCNYTTTPTPTPTTLHYTILQLHLQLHYTTL